MALLLISDCIGTHIASRYQSLLVRLREPALSVMLALQILIMVKAVISSRGDEVIDLAKTNLWR